MIDHALPSAIDVERSLIASLIYCPSNIPKALEICPVESFYSSEHSRVYKAIEDMVKAEINVDVVTLSEHIKPEGQLVVAGYMDVSTSQDIEPLCKIVVEKHIRRKAIAECEQIQRMAYGDEGIEKVMSTLEVLNSRLSDDIEAAQMQSSNKIHVVTVDDLLPQSEHYFKHGETSLSFHPGWENLKNYYRPAKGTLNVYTGIPSHGKSEIHDALMVNTALMHGWKWLVFSPENFPYYYHIQKLSEKIIGKGYFAEKNRMDENDFSSAIDFIRNHFTFIDIGEDTPSAGAVFQIIKDHCSRNECDGVVIDPWNALEVHGIGGENKTYSIGRELNRARQIARRKNLCFNIVAHPAKMLKDFKTHKYAVPKPYDIDGSANWFNMAYNCLSVYRYMKIDVIAVHVQKIKFKPHGKVGMCFLKYIKETGRFVEWYGDPEAEEEAATKQTQMNF